MSSISRMLRLRRHLLNLAEEMNGLTNRVFREDPTMGFFNFRDGFMEPRMLDYPSKYIRHYDNTANQNHNTGSDGAISTVGKEGFTLCMDVAKFKPEELIVKTVGNHIVVEGKHEEREDDTGFISRHFVRKYSLPKNYDPKKAKSVLSSDGILTIKIPLPPKPDKADEHIVEIERSSSSPETKGTTIETKHSESKDTVNAQMKSTSGSG